MDLRVLRYFVVIADSGSFTAAASIACVAQSALSRHIRELEEELGVALLRRLPRGVRLTSAGATLYESANRILNEASRVRGELSHPASSGDNQVVLGVSPTLGRVLVPGLFERCSRAPSGVALTVREAFTPTLLEWLQRGQIDVAVVTSPDTDKPFTLRPLVGEPFALVCPRAQRRPPVVTPAQLSEIPVLITNLHRRIVEKQLGFLGARLNVHSEIDSVDSIRELVLCGDWCTFMPVSVFASDAAARGAVTLSEVSGIPLNRILTLASRSEPHPASGTTLLRSLVELEFSELSRRGVFSLARDQ